MHFEGQGFWAHAMASSKAAEAAADRDQILVSVLPVVSGKVADQVADEWLDFVAACFAAKGTPRTYFQRQLQCDHKHTIIVARSKATGKILSTARIFHRRMIALMRLMTHLLYCILMGDWGGCTAPSQWTI